MRDRLGDCASEDGVVGGQDEEPPANVVGIGRLEPARAARNVVRVVLGVRVETNDDVAPRSSNGGVQAAWSNLGVVVDDADVLMTLGELGENFPRAVDAHAVGDE